jgi:hypothetical protein
VFPFLLPIHISILFSNAGCLLLLYARSYEASFAPRASFNLSMSAIAALISLMDSKKDPLLLRAKDRRYLVNLEGS